MKSRSNRVSWFRHGPSIPTPNPPRYAFGMRSFLGLVRLPALLAVLTTGHSATAPAPAIGIDSHIDTAQRILIDQANIAQRSPIGHVDIPRLKEGGVNA